MAARRSRSRQPALRGDRSPDGLPGTEAVIGRSLARYRVFSGDGGAPSAGRPSDWRISASSFFAATIFELPSESFRR